MINSKIILDFWFKECNPKMWFKKDQEFDNLITTKFQKALNLMSNQNNLINFKLKSVNEALQHWRKSMNYYPFKKANLYELV